MKRIGNGSGLSRRQLLAGGGVVLGGAAASGLLMGRAWAQATPSVVTSGRMRPMVPNGVQSGDVTASSGVVWSRTDRPARMIVEYSTTDSFKNARRVVGPAALEASDFTAKYDLTGLPAGQDIFYRVAFQDLSDLKTMSQPVAGRFRTAPAREEDVVFVWSGDTAGQGWGIDLDRGGMRIYETMRRNRPHFFIHSGDTIYADSPIKAEQEMPDGGIWKNVVTEEKSKVAETLAEFRGNYRYNLLDANVRAFNAEVPMLAQWDDHETLNNWYPGEMLLGDDRYKVKSASLLSARTRRAFNEYMPLRGQADAERIYRKVGYGPNLDIFIIDMRTFRGPNSPNRQPVPGDDTAFLGKEQLAWLKRELLGSQATWKVIAADMPIGILVRDGKTDFENPANGDGPPLGRELEIADLLRFIKMNGVRNTVWLTADVHYTAAHYYDPNKAKFGDFEPFWEFVSGPLHSGSFGPGDMDDTFGPQVVYVKSPEGRANLPPSAGLQFFGHVKIEGRTGVMTVTLKDVEDAILYSVDLTPQA